MDLELSDEQAELRDNFRSVLEDCCPPALVRAIYEDGEDGEALWKQQVELGWPSLSVPESAGGLGYGFVETALLAEELGRAAAPATLLATATQLTPALVEAEDDETLARVAAGELRGTLALAEQGRFDLARLGCLATSENGHWRVTGTKDGVLAGATAELFAVVARDAQTGFPGLFAVDRRDARVEALPGLDPALLIADVTFPDAPARVLIAPAADAEARLARVMEPATVALALHMVGACRLIFEETLAYAKIRKQYDRVIGSFQALKHRFAEMYLAVERATALCYFAAVSIAENDASRGEVAHLAKAAAGDCQRLLAEDGLQLHGGLGFTWEQDLHFWLKRAKAGEVLCGTSAWHRTVLADRLGLGRTTSTGGESA
ncbi:MAG: acyl-CoA/acyl-ACP dehydrogenase [bacterium]|nr:acyl-CoA/acyl-ACP dehydrogenase [bacterium]